MTSPQHETFTILHINNFHVQIHFCVCFSIASQLLCSCLDYNVSCSFCSAYGNLSVRSLLDTIEHCMKEFDFPDPYLLVSNFHFVTHTHNVDSSSLNIRGKRQPFMALLLSTYYMMCLQLGNFPYMGIKHVKECDGVMPSCDFQVAGRFIPFLQMSRGFSKSYYLRFI